jgi:Uma2 family endonuclease
MPAAGAFIPVEEYLHTVYEPDCDYVDGILVDRNVGEKNHAKLQRAILFYLWERRRLYNIFPSQETRLQVSQTRYRAPDICVYLGPEPDEQIFTKPPFLCIEILSPEDRLSRMQQRIDDYFAFGVAHVWLVDPQTRRAWIYRPEGMHEVRDGVPRTEQPGIEIPLAEMFAE